MRRRFRVLVISASFLPALLPLAARADTVGITPVIGSCVLGNSFGEVTPGVGAQPVNDAYSLTGLLTCATASLETSAAFTISMSCASDTLATCVPALVATVTVTFSGTETVSCSGGTANHIGLFYSLGCAADSGAVGELTAINGSFVFIPNGIPMTAYQVVGVLDLGGVST